MQPRARLLVVVGVASLAGAAACAQLLGLEDVTYLGRDAGGAFADATSDGTGDAIGSDAPVLDAGLDGFGPRAEAFGLVAVGYDHSCALRDGAAYCWGRNNLNQLGQSGGPSSTPVWVPIPVAVRAIYSGDDNICALAVNDEVWCWGFTGGGARGNPQPVPSSPQRVTIGVAAASPVTLLAVANQAGCGLVQGRTECWGDNRYGVVDPYADAAGGGAVLRPVDVVPSPSLISAGPMRVCASDGGKGFSCWGSVDGLNVRVLSADASVTGLASGAVHTCALLEGGEVWCYGGNLFGQLGDLAVQNVPDLTRVANLSGARLVRAGTDNTCVSKIDAGTFCVGSNLASQLGVGDPDNLVHGSSTEIAGLDDIVDLSLNHDHACAIRRDGTVLCWGRNNYGEVGLSPDAGPDASLVTRPRVVF